MLIGVMLAMVLEAFSILFWGWLSDVIGRRAVYAFCSVTQMLMVFPFFELLDSHQPKWVYLALVLGLPVSHGAMIGTQPALMSELFPTQVRYTGLAMGHEIASIFAGGFAPLIATGLFAHYHAAWSVSVMLLLFGAITCATLLTLPKSNLLSTLETS